MALRTFLDSRGVFWSVWNVLPQTRSGLVASPHLPAGPQLTPGLERGWLCFENPREKRRLTPIPEGWEECTDAELERLLGQANTVPKKRASLIR